MKALTLIVPVYNEEKNISEFYAQILAIREKLHSINIQIMFIDDGSKDSSLEILKKIARQDKGVSVISFSRNFGSHAGIHAGLRYTDSDAALLISVDLQDPPEVIEKMIALWNEGCDVVWAIREARKDPFLTKITAAIYSKLMRRFALPNYPQKGVDFCLIDRKVYQSIATQREKNTNIFGLILWSGFKQGFVPYKRSDRRSGISKWTFGRKVKLFVDSFVSFSFFPIRLVTYIGFVFLIIALFYIIHLIVNYFKGVPIQGWTTLAALISGGFALSFFMLGIIGEYLWRTFDESRKRPLYIINEIVNLKTENKL